MSKKPEILNEEVLRNADQSLLNDVTFVQTEDPYKYKNDRPLPETSFTEAAKLLVVVEIYETNEELKSRNPQRRFTINLYSHEDRKKLARCSWWAMHNNRIIVTYPRDSEKA